MATIKAFRPIRPNPLYADQLVFSRPQAESVSGENMPALKTLLESPARLRPETPEGQEHSYRDICETLQQLLKENQLYREDLPGIYVYEVVRPDYRQKGVWALTSLEDYRQGRIKIHESTLADSIRRMKNYREHTGLEGSPILLTYCPTIAINRMIAHMEATQPNTTLSNQQGIHRLWKLREPDMQQALIEAFAAVEVSYLADGHHRIESALGLKGCDHISSLYLATDQLRIEAYDRVVIPDRPVTNLDIFTHLQKYFLLRDATGNKPVQPTEPGNFGLYVNGWWYHMRAKEYKGQIDAALLQEWVLAPFFDILDPRTDPRLKCAGGENALEEIGALLQAHPAAIAFTLCPLTVKDLIAVADAGEVLPPKSTWIVPKVPYGLLIHQHQI